MKIITITRNNNLKNWLNISLFGQLIDNAKTEAKALRIAQSIQEQESADGSKVLIDNRVTR